MKKIILLTSLLITYFHGNSQWFPVNLHGDTKESMFVTNKDTCFYTTTGGGRIHKISPNGNFFQTQFVSEWFLDIEFTSSNIGYACGGTNFGNHTNVIVKTIDNGTTWDSITSNDFNGYSFTEVEFFSSDTGFVGGDGGLLRTMNGGQSFSQLPLPLNTFTITELYCTSNKLLLAGRKLLDNNSSTYLYTINTSNDLGNSWNEVYADTMSNANGINNRQINCIQFITENIGYAVGGNGLYLKTTDGGQTWEENFISPYSNLTTVWFTSTNVGYINNVGGIFKTTDGGVNWNAQNISPPMVISQIQFANDSVGYALGANGLYKTINSGESQVTSIIETILEESINVYPNPAKDVLQIDISNNIEIANIELFDLSGKKVKKYSSNDRNLNISGLSAGTYFLRISTTLGGLAKKVVIE